MTDKELLPIGHSNHPLAAFVALMHRHGIAVLADVRSRPYSKYVPHFDRERLQESMQNAGVLYLFLGDELGGRPSGDEFYDAGGRVLYERVAAAPFFWRGVERLETVLSQDRVAILCSEEDPARCHRYHLVGRALVARGVTIRHIRGDGRLQDDVDVAAGRSPPRQPSLFGETEEFPDRP